MFYSEDVNVSFQRGAVIERLEALSCDPEGHSLAFVPLSTTAFGAGIYLLWKQILFF